MFPTSTEHLKEFLDNLVEKFNNPSFIEQDPISIPHSYTKKQDIEIMALFAAILAWGNRKTIVNKCKELSQLFDDAPHDFIRNVSVSELSKLQLFKHRTFNGSDLLSVVHFLKHHYSAHTSLETAFFPTGSSFNNVENGLIYFKEYFIRVAIPEKRTLKHIASPKQNSACKRLNMFLRWMVRKDNCGVDFGIWNKINPSQLICPCDVHVERNARKLNLITRKQLDWLTALELTQNLKALDASDPVKYDFALFGLGVYPLY